MTTSRRVRRPFSKRRLCAAISVVLLSLVLVPALHVPGAGRARAQLAPTAVRVGASFSPGRAAALGLDYQAAFRQLERMRFRVIRLSAYWQEIDRDGYQQLDWLMAEAERSGQPVLLSVGMKGQGWPEFSIPPRLVPHDTPDGTDLADDPELRSATLAFIRSTVERYRQSGSLVAWQVENEPFNRSGPHRWWIGPRFVRQEIGLVKRIDRRPVVVSAFSHFNLIVDRASSPVGFGLRGLFGFGMGSAETEALDALGLGDVLGLDVYTEIGYRLLGQPYLARASSDWPERIGYWRAAATSLRRQAWVTEAQAEPWEASVRAAPGPESLSPKAMRDVFFALKEEGYSTVLLWGSEYWLWRARNADQRWLQTVQQILDEEAASPSIMTA